MASRDLTSAFLERRAVSIRKRSTAERLMDVTTGGSVDSSYTKLTAGGTHDLMLAEEGGVVGSASGAVELTDMRGGGKKGASPPPPAWVQYVESVENSVSKIQRMMDQLQSMHANRVGSIFGRDLADMEGKIENMTRDITDEFRNAESALQKVGMATRRAAGGAEQATVGANVQRSLAKRLQELSVTFRQSQRKYLAEVQAQKSSGVAGSHNGNGMSGNGSGGGVGAGLGGNKFGIDLGINDGSGGAGGGESSFFTTQQVAVVDDLTMAVQSRDQEIAKIAQSIEELGTIFKELAVLVIDQGTILDRIDYNMEAVVEHTKTGIKQLERAEKHQKSARPMRCIICLSITIFVLLLILLLKHRARRGWL